MMAAERDLAYMRLAWREARKGLGRTSPNPCVGAVVVSRDRVVGKGFHRRAGSPHAEPEALAQAGKLARGATLYVTLEPCNHTGRTGPCTETILSHGIRRVVVGMPDPNPKVCGGGSDFLQRQGLDVTIGILEQECRRLNMPFIKQVTTGLPWVILKAGMSLDGRIAAGPGQRTPITGPGSLAHLHRLRDRVDAILVGAETVQVDRPSLTCRLPGNRHGHDPLRVVLDTHLRLSSGMLPASHGSTAKTVVFCGSAHKPSRRLELEEAGFAVIPVENDETGRLALKPVLETLSRLQVNSLLVEGGSRVHGSFLAAGLADQLMLYVAPRFLGSHGLPLVDSSGQSLADTGSSFNFKKVRRFGDDLLIIAGRGREIWSV